MEQHNPFEEAAGLKDLARRMRQGFRLIREVKIPSPPVSPPEIQTEKTGFKILLKRILLFPWRIVRARVERIIAAKTQETRLRLDTANGRISDLEFRLEALEQQLANPDWQKENRQQQRRAL